MHHCPNFYLCRLQQTKIRQIEMRSVLIPTTEFKLKVNNSTQMSQYHPRCLLIILIFQIDVCSKLGIQLDFQCTQYIFAIVTAFVNLRNFRFQFSLPFGKPLQCYILRTVYENFPDQIAVMKS